MWDAAPLILQPFCVLINRLGFVPVETAAVSRGADQDHRTNRLKTDCVLRFRCDDYRGAEATQCHNQEPC